MSPAYRRPFPHPGGAQPPALPAELVPRHVAIVMDGNGRWANQRGLPRTKGHEAGEAALLDVVAGAIEVGVTHLSAYAFSTENWKRSPDEVRFLMGFNRDVIRRRRDQLHEWGVRMRWVGRRPRLWGSVIKELETAQELTRHNTGLTLYFCVNYGGRAEIMDGPHSGAIGGTYIGNPVAQAAALAVLDVFEEESLLDRAVLVGDRIRERMLGWQSRWLTRVNRIAPRFVDRMMARKVRQLYPKAETANPGREAGGDIDRELAETPPG